MAKGGIARRDDLIELHDDHIHNPVQVYPTLTTGVTVTAAVGAWALGATVDLIPINTITTSYDIHFLSIENISSNDVYELHLFLKSTDENITQIRFVQNAVQDTVMNLRVQVPIINRNEGVYAKLACANGSNEVIITAHYHGY